MSLAAMSGTIVAGTADGFVRTLSTTALRRGYVATGEPNAAPLAGFLAGEVGAGLQYATALGFLAIDVGQVLAFGFAASTPPSLAPVAQELEHLQDFGLDAVSYRLVFGAALSIIAASVVIFFVQEHVELRAFVEPESFFPLLFLAMGGSLSTLAGPGFLPVLKVRLN